MPNWCSNQLFVSGPKKALKAFQKAVYSERIEPVLVLNVDEEKPAKAKVIKLPLDFDRVLPMPRDPREQLAQAEGTWPDVMDKSLRESMGLKRDEEGMLRDAWYNWHVAFWGTKWNLSDDTQVTEEPKKLSYFFDTAWSPPEPVVAAMAKQHPKLVFLHQYWELGNDFAGWSEYKEGALVNHEEGQPSTFDFVPQEEYGSDEVLCSVCGKLCLERTAHIHQDKWIGDECCWDERLKASE